MIIAIDFDGTIASDKYDHDGGAPGDELPGTIAVIKELQAAGHTLILWTCRGGEWLQQAVDWLAARDVVFDFVNEGAVAIGGDYWPRKIFAHIYVDDRSVVGLAELGEV